MKSFCALLACLVLAGCNAFAPPRYTVRLMEVERPAQATERYGPSKITKSDSAQGRYIFEDGLLRAFCFVGTTQIAFDLTNKTNFSMKIPWDEAAYVSLSGQSMRVIHAGVKLADRSSPQAPSIIAKGATLSDAVTPADNITMDASTVKWTTSVLEPSLYRISRDSAQAVQDIQGFNGKTMRVVLPIQIEGVTNEYTFSFAVVSAP